MMCIRQSWMKCLRQCAVDPRECLRRCVSDDVDDSYDVPWMNEMVL